MERIILFLLPLLLVKTQKLQLQFILKTADLEGTWAAPVASLMIEQYLTGEVKRQALEDYIYTAIIARK